MIVETAPPLTAGRFLELRRMAHHRTITEAAKAYEHKTLSHQEAELVLIDAEADRVTLDLAELRRLQRCFQFDARVYLALAGAEHLKAPDICRSCGCTWFDPCAGGCAWADEARTICTACVPKAISGARP